VIELMIDWEWIDGEGGGSREKGMATRSNLEKAQTRKGRPSDFGNELLCLKA
jgi:hypothetical protein